jgi:hypothetical protein
MNLNEAQLTIYNYNCLKDLQESFITKEIPNENNLITIISKNKFKLQEFTKTYKEVISKMETDLKETGVDIELYNKKVDGIFDKVESKLSESIKNKDITSVKDIFKNSIKEITRAQKDVVGKNLIPVIPFVAVKLALKIIGLFKFFIKFLIRIMFSLLRPFEKFKKVLIPIAVGVAVLFLYPALVRLKEIFYNETPKWDIFETLMKFDMSEYLNKVHETGVYIFIKDIIVTIFNTLDSMFGDTIKSLLEFIMELF